MTFLTGFKEKNLIFGILKIISFWENITPILLDTLKAATLSKLDDSLCVAYY